MSDTSLRLRKAKTARSNVRAFLQPNAEVPALLCFRGRAQSVSVRSVSRAGMTLEYACGLQAGEAVSVQLFSSRTLSGRVRWSLAAACGVAFATPLAEDDPVLLSQY